MSTSIWLNRRADTLVEVEVNHLIDRVIYTVELGRGADRVELHLEAETLRSLASMAFDAMREAETPAATELVCENCGLAVVSDGDTGNEWWRHLSNNGIYCGVANDDYAGDRYDKASVNGTYLVYPTSHSVEA